MCDQLCRAVINPTEIVIYANKINEIFIDWEDFKLPKEHVNTSILIVRNHLKIYPWRILTDCIYWSPVHEKVVIPIGTSRTITLQPGVVLDHVRVTTVYCHTLHKIGKTILKKRLDIFYINMW